MRFLLLLLCSLLTACASAPTALPPAQSLFHDERFAPPSQRINADEVFALDDRMRRYVEQDIGQQLRVKGVQRGLIDALYHRGELKLEYDSAMTRNAAQAFDARTGNCLSLVIMTAAFAKELGLPVRFQTVYVPETWSRSGDLYFSSGHVNLSIGKRPVDARAVFDLVEYVTIDFLRPRELRGHHTQVIDEDTIVAMYMNNRAAESLAAGRVDDAYWWARGAVQHMPTFLTAYNTLGVIYNVHGDTEQAARVLRQVLAVEPANRHAMANLVPVLQRLGRTEEAREVAQRLARIESQPPFHYFSQGMAAMHARDFVRAKALFQREVDRAAYYHEFHFWLAMANLGLGDTKEARKHLAVALDNSTTRNDRDLYAAKLEHLKPTRMR
jgi:tetratricopeptide (TPR) repeat protein